MQITKNWLTIGRQIENCSISHILYDEKMGTFHIERLNDFAHFEDKDYLLKKTIQFRGKADQHMFFN